MSALFISILCLFVYFEWCDAFICFCCVLIDATTRNQAELYLSQAADSNFVRHKLLAICHVIKNTLYHVMFFPFLFSLQGQFLLALCGEFAGDNKNDQNRQLAGLYLKNLLTMGKVSRHRDCSDCSSNENT